MLTPDIGAHAPYTADWAQPFTGTWDAWLALRDLEGLSAAVTALCRIQAKVNKSMTAEQATLRNHHLELARQIITAEREILLREFHKRLADVI